MTQFHRSSVLSRLYLLLLLACCSSCGQKAVVPTIVSTPYTSTDGNLTVDFPAPFKVDTQRSDTAVGEIVIELATCEFNDSALSTASTLYPFDADEFDAVESLEGAVEGVIRSCNGSLLKSYPLELNGMPGQEGVVHVQDNIYYRYRIVVNGKTPSLYIVQVVGKKAWVQSETMSAFIESMQVPDNEVSSPAE